MVKRVVKDLAARIRNSRFGATYAPKYAALGYISDVLTSPIGARLNSSWIPAVEDLARLRAKHYFTQRLADRYVTKSAELGTLDQADIRWFAKSTDDAIRKLDAGGHVGGMREAWIRATGAEIERSQRMAANTPMYVYDSLRRSMRDEMWFFTSYGDTVDFPTLVAAAAGTHAVRESESPTKTAIGIVKESLKVFGKDYRAHQNSQIIKAALSSRWAAEHFDGIARTLFPERFFGSTNRPVDRTSSYIMPLLFDDLLVEHAFNPSRYDEIYETAQRLAARIPADDVMTGYTLKFLGQLLPLDSRGFTEFLDKHVKGSTHRWKCLSAFTNADERLRPCIEYFLKHKPGKTVELAEHIRLANLFEIRIPKLFEETMTPLSMLTKDRQDAMTDASGGTSQLEELYVRFVRARLRSESVPQEKAAQTLDRSRATMHRWIERLHIAPDEAARNAMAKEISQRITQEGFEFFSRRLADTAKARVKDIFGVTPTAHHLLHPAFLDGVAMALKTRRAHDRRNMASATELITRFLSDEALGGGSLETYPLSRRENIAWLSKRLTGRARDTWLGGMYAEYPVSATGVRANTEDRIRNFCAVAADLMREVPSSIRLPEEKVRDPRELESWFMGLDAADHVRSTWYPDMKIQIEGIIQARKARGSAKEAPLPTKLVFRKEEDPMRALMLGTWVNNSCLDAGKTNSWSAFANACEANKAVIWISDEKDRLLGRVLIAIDKKARMVRFPTYYTGAGLDLDPYVNRYLTDQAAAMGIATDGDRDKVELLFCDEWYRDPQISIFGQDAV